MTKKNILLLEGFCRLPWMEDQLVDSYLSSSHRLKRVECYQRDAKTLNRSFDPAAVSSLEKELASGKYHSIVVVDLVQDLDIFESKIGPILQKFVREGGAIGFPCSELPAVATISKLFGAKWTPGDYTRTDWVVYEENVLLVETTFGQDVTTLSKQQCVALRNVPANEKCYGLTPPERNKLPPLPSGSINRIDESKQPEDTDAGDFDVCVAIHECDKGCIAFFGEVDCQPDTIKLLTGFLTNRSPASPVDAFARLSKSNFEQVRLHKEKGNENFRKGEFAEAIQFYKKALDVYGDKAGGYGMERQEHANLFANLAECYLRLSEYANVVETATKALELLPDHLKARMRRCKAYLGTARSSQNLRSVEMAVGDLSLLKPTNDEERHSVASLRQQATALEDFIKKKKTESFQTGFARAVTGQSI